MKALNRKDAVSIKSQHWTLYNPEDVAKKLDVAVDKVDLALEETGFNKAVRIRELVIKWKTRLIQEQKDLKNKEEELRKQLKSVKNEQYFLENSLREVRNILRIPRENVEEEQGGV